MPTSPAERSQANFNRNVGHTTKETKKHPRNSLTASQLSKPDSIYWEFEWRICWRIPQWIWGVWLADFLADSAAEFLLLEWRILRRIFCGGFSNGIHDPNLSLQKLHCRIVCFCGAILQACRGQIGTKQANGPIPSSALVCSLHWIGLGRQCYFSSATEVSAWNGSCSFGGPKGCEP